MNITAAQSKRLRYLCTTLQSSQCYRKYTRTANGKIRVIGIYEYGEVPGELLYFKWNGMPVCLDIYVDADDFMNCLKESRLLALQGLTTPANTHLEETHLECTVVAPAEVRQIDMKCEVEVLPKPMGTDAIREIAMTAAARDAVARCERALGDELESSTEIVRENAAVPGFLDIYAESLRIAGTPLTLEELADIFPAQRDWIMKQGESK